MHKDSERRVPAHNSAHNSQNSGEERSGKNENENENDAQLARRALVARIEADHGMDPTYQPDGRLQNYPPRPQMGPETQTLESAARLGYAPSSSATPHSTVGVRKPPLHERQRMQRLYDKMSADPAWKPGQPVHFVAEPGSPVDYWEQKALHESQGDFDLAGPYTPAYGGTALLASEDPDIHLGYNEGGSVYFKERLSRDETRDLSLLDQRKAIELSTWLYQTNPIAKRLISRVVAYLLGDELKVKHENDAAQEVLDQWWAEDNWERKLPGRVRSWLIAGDILLPAAVTRADGSVRTGFLPSEMIEHVETARDNIEDVRSVIVSGRSNVPQRRFAVIQEETNPYSDNYQRMSGLTRSQRQLVREWRAIPDKDVKKFNITPNPYGEAFFWRFAGLPNMTRGLPFLYSIADYLDGYEALMWDMLQRAGIANAWFAHMSHGGADEKTVQRMAAEYGARAPMAGSMIHTNERTTVNVLSPQLVANGADVFADLILGVIGSGGGVPTYWLNSQLDPNRASAEQMALPVLRDMRQLQSELLTIIEDMARFVIDQAVLAKRLPESVKSKVKVEAPPLTEKSVDQAAATFAQTAQGLAVMRAEQLMPREVAVEVVSLTLGGVGIEITPEEMLESLKKEKEEAEAEKAAAEEKEAAKAAAAPPQLPAPDANPAVDPNANRPSEAQRDVNGQMTPNPVEESYVGENSPGISPGINLGLTDSERDNLIESLTVLLSEDDEIVSAAKTVAKSVANGVTNGVSDKSSAVVTENEALAEKNREDTVAFAINDEPHTIFSGITNTLPTKRLLCYEHAPRARLWNARLAQIEEGLLPRLDPLSVQSIGRGLYEGVTEEDRAILSSLSEWQEIPVNIVIKGE